MSALPSNHQLKHDLRHQYRCQPLQQRAAVSAAICEQLLTLSSPTHSSIVIGFSATQSEPDLESFYTSQSPSIYLPAYCHDRRRYCLRRYVHPSQRILGPYRIPEPPSSSPQLELRPASRITWLVPGVSFDRYGNRLGHGMGIYDQLLQQQPGRRIGLCPKPYLHPSVLPTDPHDQPMDVIVTDTIAYYRLS